MVSAEVALLGGPWLIGMITLGAAVVLEQWPLLLPRYLNPGFVLLGLLAASATVTRRGQIITLAAAALFSLAVAAVWVYTGGAFLFPGVGTDLGIQA